MTKKKSPQKQLPQTVTIKRDETQPESMELIAKAIIDVAAAFQRMTATGAKRELITLLLHDMTKVGKPDIRAILMAAPKIADAYLTR